MSGDLGRDPTIPSSFTDTPYTKSLYTVNPILMQNGLHVHFYPLVEMDKQVVPRIIRYLPKNNQWKEKYMEPVGVDSAVLPELPEGWVWAKVNQIADIISGSTPKGINVFDNEGEIDFYKVSDMNSYGNELFMTSAAISISKDVATKLRLRICDRGTVIFPKRGGAIATNKKRLLSKPSAYDLNVMGLSPKISFKYLFYWIEPLDLASLGDGSNVPQINNKDIVPLNIPISPFVEQERIVAEVERRLSVVAAPEQAINTNLGRAERLRQSILGRAFTGQLVPQAVGAGLKPAPTEPAPTEV